MNNNKSYVKDNTSDVLALLGPTNTGKTFYAIEQMLSYDSGMIGLPLRLLAREVYDKVVSRVGVMKAALITGEESQIPLGAKYFICTVEAMPVNKPVSFLAVDEIQLAADPERGHVFTDRLLNARGKEQTLFLGSDTVAHLINALLPVAKIKHRKRFSKLEYLGKKKLSNLPPRTAVVAFSTSDVYYYADFIRRQYGGAAVVLGALSPRARNAQVSMYQAGEVDHIVATDAIGLGLNMDLSHVAFASTYKFDGFNKRSLSPLELAQIAGRAGRFKNFGTFGETSDCKLLDGKIVNSIENHQFRPFNYLYWRNSNLDFSSLENLSKSLAVSSSSNLLMLSRRISDDEQSLNQLMQNSIIRHKAINRDSIQLLWDVCAIPDYRKNLDGTHVDLMAKVYLRLLDYGDLSTNWISKELKLLDSVVGSIDLLLSRLAHVRVWNYITNRSSWIKKSDNEVLKTLSKRTEEKLSDSLHVKLTESFVNKKATFIQKSLNSKNFNNTILDKKGSVYFGKNYIGQLAGFNINYDPISESVELKRKINFCRKILPSLINSKLKSFLSSKNDDIVLSNDGVVKWREESIAYLISGEKLLAPSFRLYGEDLLNDQTKKYIGERISSFIQKKIFSTFQPLIQLDNTKLKGVSRGVAFQLRQENGVLSCRKAKEELKALTSKDRKNLYSYGIKIGRENIWIPSLLVNRRTKIGWMLGHIYLNKKLQRFPKRLIIETDKDLKELWAFMGYQVVSNLAIRVEFIEKISFKLGYFSRKKIQFKNVSDVIKGIDLKPKMANVIIHSMGYKLISNGNKKIIVPVNNNKKGRARLLKKNNDVFSVLAEL